MPGAVTVRPESIDEMHNALHGWLATAPKPLRTTVRIRRMSGNTGLVVHSKPRSPITVRATPDLLVLRGGGRRMNLLLDNFDVSTEFRGEFIVVEMKYASGTTLRPRSEGLSSAAKARHSTFAVRALRAVADLERAVSPQKLAEASAAPNDFLVLVDALAASPALTEVTDKDPLAAAKLRGVKRQQDLIAAGGGIVSAGRMAKLLGISRQAVDKRRRRGRLLGLTQGRRGYAYPLFQFANGTTIQGLNEVLDALRSHSPWMQLAFFVNPNERLAGRTPLDALRRGDAEGVVQTAGAFGEHGAA